MHKKAPPHDHISTKRRALHTAALLLVAVLAATATGACSKNGRGTTGATVPTERTTTTTTIDVTKVPATITVDYANAVMKSLDHASGEAIRYLVAKRAPDQHFYDLLDAIYDEPELARKKSSFGQLAARGFDNVRTDPGDPATTVTQMLSASKECVFIETDRSLAAVFVNPPPAGTTKVFVALRANSTGSDPGRLNPTAWSLILDGNSATGEVPSNRCESAG